MRRGEPEMAPNPVDWQSPARSCEGTPRPQQPGSRCVERDCLATPGASSSVARVRAKIPNRRHAQVPRCGLRTTWCPEQEHTHLPQGDQAQGDQSQQVDPQVGRRVPPLPARLCCHHPGHRLQCHGVPLLAGASGSASGSTSGGACGWGGGLRWRRRRSGSGRDPPHAPWAHP